MNNIATLRGRNLNIIKLKNTAALLNSKLLSSSPSIPENEKFDIPKRIPRGPTDILRVLESTISRDPTAAHYKFHDDPYLIPMSNMGKRTFAMAQEAGRKAAHWVRQQHADLFQHQEADPPIKAFFPRLVYTEDSEVTEQDLKNVIENAQTSDAVLVYKLLQNKGENLSPDTVQSLLELLCYSNTDNLSEEEFIEERWFKQSSKAKERQRKTWKDGNFAEELFIGIENPTAESYTAIISGMAKYYQVDRAKQLFEEAQQKGLVLKIEAYNSLIRVSNFIKEDFDMRWVFITDMLSSINKAGVKPNLGTLNAVLQSVSYLGAHRQIKDYTLATLKEFKSLGIEPSLGSWYWVLKSFYKDRGPTSTILFDIMNEIENKEHKIRDMADTNFFVSAMDICRYYLKNMDLAHRVDKLLHYGNNYDLIGDSYKESVYYRNYFNLLLVNYPLDEFMSVYYNNLVPHIYVPEPSVMEEVLHQVEIVGAIEHIPKLWSDMIVFDHTRRESLIDLVTNILINVPTDNAELTAQCATIALNIYDKINNQNEERINPLSFTGDLLGKIMILVLRNNDFTNACVVMDKLDKDHSSIVGVPKIEALEMFIDHCILNKSPSRALICLQYCSDSGFTQLNSLAAKINEALTLNEEHQRKLQKLVGEAPIKNKSKNA